MYDGLLLRQLLKLLKIKKNNMNKGILLYVCTVKINQQIYSKKWH